MKKKFISTVLAASMLASACGGLMPTAFAAANTPQYQTKARQMEELNRGLIAVRTTADTRGQAVNGVYLSWRLLGTESLENQAFDIYRNGVKIYTTGAHDATCYIDTDGSATDKYKVVKKGAGTMEVAAEPAVTPIADNYYAKPSEVGKGNSVKNSFTYIDIPIERPADEKAYNGDWSYYYNLDKDHEGGANDASVGDLDGDGDYEIVLKWDPTNSKDASSSGYSGRVYIDAYEIDPNLNATTSANGHLYNWRIDLGQNVRAGAHDTQFLVYDFDGDGKSEIAMQTALGSKDGTGEFVTKVGDTEEIRNYTDEENNTVYERKGHNIGPDFYTVFDGETGKALCTTAGIPLGREDGGDWGDSKMQRSHRFLAAVAYIDGVHPSIVMCRGYYARSVVRAYTWDGSEMVLQWEHIGAEKAADSLYGQGNHNLSVADVDNDGRDEIVYGSAVLDDNGKAIGNTYLGHGDAIHVNDFNNDGVQEVFSVKEKSEGYKNNAADFRVAGTGQNIWGRGASGDTGRGVMDNIDDAYAAENPNALSLAWSSSHTNVFDLNGNELKTKPASAGSGSFDNFLVFWDGDLGRELLDTNIIQKYDAANGWSKRFYGPSDGYTLTGGTTNNYTKRNPCLVADLWGDWREEIIMAKGKGKDETPALRIFTSTMPTDYRLTTLMHDSQYRMAIAWQNIAYNQPPHTSYYVGSAALATDESGNKLNYLAPAVPFTKVTYQPPTVVDVKGVTLSESSVNVEKGKTVVVNAIIEPSDATKKGISWTSSDTSVATVVNGVIKGVSEGTATVTATTKDGGFTASCEVTVFAKYVTGVTLSEKVIEVGVGYTAELQATVYPEDASDKTVIWESADTGVAVVSGGVVTGMGYGKTKVIARTADGNKTAECIVKVKPIEDVDATGTDSFASASTDTGVSFSGSANGGLLSLTNAATGAEFSKSFTPYDTNKAVLKFKFTTGGQKLDGSNWNWTGHEYTMGLSMLDKDGNNILTMEQPYAASAGTLTSKIGSADAKGMISDWTTVIDNSGYIQGSAKRWIVTMEFDYDNDVCDVTVEGTDANWSSGLAKYTKTFSLNGASFATLKCYLKQDGTGTITANPKIEALSYMYKTTVSGAAETNYESGTQSNPMTAAEIDGWVQTGTDIASLEFDSENNRIWYNPIEPAGEYSASKQFDIAENGLVTYDVDWYFGSSVGRDGNFEYIQFGDKLRIGWTNGYLTWVSTDGGQTWNDNDGDGTADSIFTGSNTTFVKNIKVVFDTANNAIKSLIFDGNKLDAYTDYKFADATAADTVTFGFTRGGKPPAWGIPNGIDRIKVSQFAYGEEEPDFSSVKITGFEGNTANIAYTLVDYNKDSAVLIGALYDDMGNLVETKVSDNILTDDSIQHIRTGESSLTFEKNPAEYELKVFMWDSLNGMMPVCDTADVIAQ